MNNNIYNIKNFGHEGPSEEEIKREQEVTNRLGEIFGNNSNIETGEQKSSKYIVVGKDHEGNDIVVNTDPRGELQMSPDIIKKVNDPEWIRHNREDAKNKRKQLLDNWFNNSKATGPIAHDFVKKNDLFEIPQEFVHMLTEIEDEDEDLDDRSKHIIKDARKNSTVVEPDLLKGLVDAIDSGAGYKNMIWVTDFMKYLKERNVNFSMLKNDMAAVKVLYNEWHALKRPSIPIILQRLIKECDELFFQWLDGPVAQKLGEDVRKILRTDTGSRVEFLKDMEIESGQKLYTIDDFILLKFQLQEYGLHKEDQEWFNRDTQIPNRPGVTMGNYLDEFRLRTGWSFEDVYYHYWKEVEKENKEKQKDDEDTIGESSDGISLVEGKENETEMLKTEEPDIISKVINQSDDNEFKYDDDDII